MFPRIAAAPVAFAIRAVLHGDEPGLDQRPADRLHPRRRQAKRFLLHRGRGPHDRLPLPPVLRLREAEQPVHRTRRGDRPSCGAAALKAASNPSDAPSPRPGRPAKLSAVRSACSRPGVSRRKPVGVGAKLCRCALWAPFVSITISLSVRSRRANLPPQRKLAVSA